jgi:hypothetical protein
MAETTGDLSKGRYPTVVAWSSVPGEWGAGSRLELPDDRPLQTSIRELLS